MAFVFICLKIQIDLSSPNPTSYNLVAYIFLLSTYL